MRTFLIFLLLALVLAGAGYLRRDELLPYWQKVVYQVRTARGPEATPEPATPAGEAAATPSLVPQKTAPGIFLMTVRVPIVSGTGVKAILPGEEVRLMERLPKGRLRVKAGSEVLEVEPSQVTDDVNVGREAERRFRAAPAASP